MARTFRILLGICFFIVISFVAWQLLPTLIGRLPNSVQQQLPHDVRALVSTPLPTALPAPDIDIQTTAVFLIPTLSPTETATSAAPNTNVPTLLPNQTPIPSATTTPTPTPLPTSTPLPATSLIEGLIIDPQGFNNCGPTNLSIVLTYHGHAVDQDAIANILRPAYEDKNVSPSELATYVNNQTTLKAIVLHGGEMTLLKQLLTAGFPVIVEEGLLPSEWEGWMGHYLTLYGYDDNSQTFMSMDTYLGPWDSSGLPTDYTALAETWQHFNNALLIVYPSEREADLFTILSQERLDPATMWQHATEKAQTAVSTNPENAFAWFNLGSGLTHLGELTGEHAYFEGAAAAFDRARTLGLPWRMLWYQFEPYVAYLENGRYDDVVTLANATINSGGEFMEESYLYRGHAMRGLGYEGQAQLDFAHVVEINPQGQPATEATKALD